MIMRSFEINKEVNTLDEFRRFFMISMNKCHFLSKVNTAPIILIVKAFIIFFYCISNILFT